MRRFGLIGRPLGHSASAAYFAAKFEREGIADCTYTLYELPEIGALERLLAEGCTDVVVQPTHVMNGEEYHKLLAQAEQLRERMGGEAPQT